MSINMTQSFLYETDSLDSFEKVLDTMVRVMHKEQPSEYAQLFVTKRADAFSDGKRWIGPKEMSASNPKGWSKPKFLHVCSIGDYKGEMKEEDEPFENYANLVQKVIEHLKNADAKKFFEQCGDGYTDWFNHFDGSIDGGYRLNQRPSGGWDNLDISLCHMYYGK